MRTIIHGSRAAWWVLMPALILLFACQNVFSQANNRTELEPNYEKNLAMAVSPGDRIEASWSWAAQALTRNGVDTDYYKFVNFDATSSYTIRVTPSTNTCRYGFGLYNEGPFTGEVTLTIDRSQPGKWTTIYSGGNHPEIRKTFFGAVDLNGMTVLTEIAPVGWYTGFQCTKNGPMLQDIPYVLTISASGAVQPSGGGAAAAHPAGNWDLTGTWLDSSNSVYEIRQSGSSVTWSAHSADNRTWGHVFTGTIMGDIVEGDFQDVPPFSNRYSGHIKVRIVDALNMQLVSSSGPFGTSAWTRKTSPPSVSTPSSAERIRKACLVGLFVRWTDCDTGQASRSDSLIPGIGTLIVTDGGKAIQFALTGGAGDYTVEAILTSGMKVRVALMGPDATNVRLLEDGIRMGWRIVGNRLVLP